MTIYLDNLAATPVDPRVVARHAAVWSELTGNPNGVENAAGQRAGSILEDARRRVAAFMSREAEEVTFTPGASMALWIAVQDAAERTPNRPARVLASAVEHPALLKHLAEAERGRRVELTLFPVDRLGGPDLAALRRLCRDGVDLVCMMAANNETGTIAPVAEIVAIAREHGARTLVDASQTAGRIGTANLADVDLAVISGAKMYGPRGVGGLAGCLARRTREAVAAMLGTPDVAGATALALACALRQEEMAADECRIRGMRDLLQSELLANVPGLTVNGDPDARLAGALHVSSPHAPGEAVVARLWGIIDVSTGAACQSGVPGPSHVLTAMRLGDGAAEGAVRIGVGRFNDEAQIRAAAGLLAEAMGERAAAIRRCG